jgi:hypothetical protein
LANTYSEDTIIFSALTAENTDADVIFNALKDFFNRKKEIDYNDRYNGIVFTKRGPQYLEDFTLYPENILKAIKLLQPHLTKANIAGGIFITATFVAEVFKKISGKVFRLIILIDQGSTNIEEDHIFFLRDLLNKVREIPFIMDVIAINTSDPIEELKLMKLCRRTGGDIHEITVDYEWIKAEANKVVIDEKFKQPSILDKLSKLSKAPLLLSKRRKSEVVKEPEDLNQLKTKLAELAKKKDIKHGIIDEDNKIEIPDESLIFFESLADKLSELKGKEKEKCTVCFTSVSKNRELLRCPSCQTYVHKICAAIWAKTSHIASNTPHIFRCHNCFALIRLDENFCKLVNNAKTPVIELFGMEDIVLEEYLESLESDEGPKLISTEDAFAISVDEEEVDLIMKEEVEIVWCPNCGKMTSNEFVKCPKCSRPLRKEGVSFESAEAPKEAKKTDEPEEITKDISETEKISEPEEITEEISETDIEAEAIQIIAEIQERFEDIKAKFNSLVEQNKVDEAYKFVEEFKNANKNVLEDLELDDITAFFKEAKQIWEEFSTKHKEYLEQKKLIEEEEVRIQKKKEQLDKIQTVLAKSSELAEKFEFEEAIKILGFTYAEIDMEELDSYKGKLREKQQEIQNSKNAYDLLHNEFTKLEDSFEQNHKDGKLHTALEQSKRLVKMAEELGKSNLIEDFKSKATEIQKKIDEIKELKKKLRTLFKEGLELLESDDLEGTIDKAKEISEFILKNFKQN